MKLPLPCLDRKTLLSPPVVIGAAIGLGLVWIYWPSLVDLVHRWGTNAQYSHGYLVPLFALFLLWWRRGQLVPGALQPSWWGLGLLAIGLAVRFAGTYLFFDWLAAAAIVPILIGFCVLLGGWAALRWAWPAILFLAFMVPLPHRVEVMLAYPLQRIATIASTYALQTLGVSAFSEGNVIRMGQIRLNVLEACSGLSMLMIFFALSTAVVILFKRPWLDKVVIVLSAAPIALVANISRITVTGVAHKLVGPEVADLIFHGLAGWLMMVLALGLLWVEFGVLSWVLATVEEPEPLPMMPGGQPVPVGIQGAPPPVSARGYLKPKASAMPRLKKGR